VDDPGLVAPTAEMRVTPRTVPSAEVEVPTASTPEQPTGAPRAREAQAPSASGSPQKGRLAVPTAQIANALRRAAESEGVNYAELYAVAGSESSFKADAKASGSSATGLLQITDSTWDYLTTKMYPELGYTRSDRTDPQKAAVVGARYLKDIRTALRRRVGHEPSVGEVYLGYFMGVSGASKFIDAMTKNPQAHGAELFPKAAKANPNLFFNKDGSPLTLQDTFDRLSGKVTRYYAQANEGVKASESAVAVTEGSSVKPIAFTPTATAEPQAVTVPPPDFGSVPSGAKGEMREQDGPGRSNLQNRAPANKVVPPSEETKVPITYMRDKQGRLVAIRG
jgi:hypothetical protein